MKEYYPALKNSILFQGISQKELSAMLHCLSAYEKTYDKGEFLIQSGQAVDSIGFILTGSVMILKDDCWGNRSIITKLKPGHLFGEAYACSAGTLAAVNVIACEHTAVLFLNVRRITTVCSSACGFHTRLIRNLLSVLANNALMLNQKIEHISQRTTREKLLAYLSEQALSTGAHSFSIPFNRQELADYLCVDRSAMSGELSRMQKEGILRFSKNHFTLLNKELHFPEV